MAGVDDDDQDIDTNNDNDPKKALKVADEIDLNGLSITKLMIKELNNQQRKIAVRAVFHKLITGKKMSRVHEQTVIEKNKYLLGHG